MIWFDVVLAIIVATSPADLHEILSWVSGPS